MTRLRAAAAVLVVVAVSLAFGPGVDIGYSRAESGVSHAYWSDGPEAVSSGGPGGSIGYEIRYFEPSGLLNARVVAAPRRMHNALGRGLVLEAGHGPAGPTGAQMRLLSGGGDGGAQPGEERPLLLLTVDESELTYLGAMAQGKLKVRWGYASAGPLPAAVYRDGVFHFEMGAGSGGDETSGGDAEGDPVWQAVGGVTVEWKASGVFTKGHAEARMAEAATRAIFEVLRKCWTGAE